MATCATPALPGPPACPPVKPQPPLPTRPWQLVGGFWALAACQSLLGWLTALLRTTCRTAASLSQRASFCEPVSRLAPESQVGAVSAALFLHPQWGGQSEWALGREEAEGLAPATSRTLASRHYILVTRGAGHCPAGWGPGSWAGRGPAPPGEHVHSSTGFGLLQCCFLNHHLSICGSREKVPLKVKGV